jgi:hypothetical protein
VSFVDKKFLEVCMYACSKENVLPSFFVDDSENAKDEYLVDYWLSWILRCAKEESKDQNKNLIKYSRRMLSYLLSRGKDNGFFPVYWCDLKKAMDMTELTNNALFDEFWFNWENDVMKNM